MTRPISKRINLFVDPRLDAWLTMRANKTGVSKNEYIRMVLMAHGRKVKAAAAKG